MMTTIWREIAKSALGLALLLAATPARDQSGAPLAGVRTALELVNKQPSKALRAASFM
jgi:hypothetical protein